MTTIDLYGGPLKREIVKRMWGLCGRSTEEGELDAEDYARGLMALNDAVSELEDNRGIVLGFNYPDSGEGGPEEESGIPRGAVRAIVAESARFLAASIGKELSGEAKAEHAGAMASLSSKYATIPQMEMRRGTPRGAGNKPALTRYFITDVSDNEPVQ